MSSWQQYPTPNYPASPYAAPVRWYRTEGPAKALRVLMVLTIIALGLLAIAYAVDHSAYTSYDVGDGSLDTVQNADAFLGFASLLSGGLTIAVFVLTVIWQWRLAKNHQQLGRPGTSLGPGWAIGGWFIPLANFVLPFIQFRDLWRGADPEAQPNAWKQGRVSPVLWLWWGLFVGAYVIEMVTSFRLTFGTVEAAGDQAVGGPIAATVCRMVAGVFFSMVVGRLTERQERAIATTLATGAAAGMDRRACGVGRGVGRPANVAGRRCRLSRRGPGAPAPRPVRGVEARPHGPRRLPLLGRRPLDGARLDRGPHLLQPDELTPARCAEAASGPAGRAGLGEPTPRPVPPVPPPSGAAAPPRASCRGCHCAAIAGHHRRGRRRART